MAKSFEKLRKLKGRSLQELKTRGGQAVSAYTEKLGLGGQLLSDQEVFKYVRKEGFSPSEQLTAQSLLDKFYSDSETRFFPSFVFRDETRRCFKSQFGKNAGDHFVSKADKILSGRFDLLGFTNLDFGSPVDWHFEPVADVSSPVKHWKEFDELDSKESGDKKIIWELNRHRHFFDLGAAYFLTGDEEYAECFAEHLKGWMNQNPPGMGVNWVSSLEISFRLISWVWALHLFRDSKALTPDLFLEALKFVIAQCRHIEKYLSTYYSPNTHLTGEALGLYYAGTQFSFLEHAEKWRLTGEEILCSEISRQVQKDGVYFEQSTWYHRYTTDYYLHFLILQRLNGLGTERIQEAKVTTILKKLLDAQMHFTRPDGSSPMIGDDDGGMMLPLTSDAVNDFRGTLALGAAVYKRGDYKWVAGEQKQHVLWLLGPEGRAIFDSMRSFKPESRSKAFYDSGFYVMRDGWTEDDNYLIVDAGEVGSLNGGHGHADTLSFELAVGGRPILVDSGTYTYHKSKELRDSYRSGIAHNTLTIDNLSSSICGGKFSWESMAEPLVLSWISQDRFDYFEGSHDGYRHLENSSAEYSRSILFLKNDYWIMRDFVKTAGEHEYQQNFHYDVGCNPQIENIDNGQWCVTEAPENKIGMRLFTFGDNGGWQRKESWISSCYGSRTGAPFLRYVSKGIGPQEFLTFMIPAEIGFELPEVHETEVVGGRAFVVNYRDYRDIFVFADGGQIIRTELFHTDFRFFWSRMAAGDKLPEEFVMIDGNHFSLGGREIINYPNRLEFATARRFGNKLNVRTSENVFSVSLPVKKSKMYILKSTPEL